MAPTPLAVVLTLHHGLLRDWTTRKRVLLAANWCFYASWSVRFLGLLIGLTVTTFLWRLYPAPSLLP